MQNCSVPKLSVATWAELCSQPAPNPDSLPCLLIRASAAITHVPGGIIYPKNLLWVFSALMSVCDRQYLLSGARSAHPGRSTEDFPSCKAGEPGWLLLPSRCSFCLQPIIPNLSHEKRLIQSCRICWALPCAVPWPPERQATSRPGILAVNLAGSFPHCCLNQKYFCCSNWTNIFKLSTVLFSNNS